MTLLLVILLKPFVALFVLVPVRMLVVFAERKIPESRLKRALFSPLPGHSRSRR